MTYEELFEKMRAAHKAGERKEVERILDKLRSDAEAHPADISRVRMFAQALCNCILDALEAKDTQYADGLRYELLVLVTNPQNKVVEEELKQEGWTPPFGLPVTNVGGKIVSVPEPYSAAKRRTSQWKWWEFWKS